MISIRVAFLLIFLTRFFVLRAQEYSFTHYDTKEGLAGSTAYCITQDKEGFLWIGTENGLSRFDGTRFVNYSVLEGLPDNEVLNLYADSKGRLWITAFKVSICYYYKGKIYNTGNDPGLQKIKLTTNVWQVAEDRDGNILFMENHQLHLLKPDGQVNTFNTRTRNANFISISARTDGGFWVMENNELMILNQGSLIPHEIVDLAFNHSNFVSVTKNTIAFRSALGQITVQSVDKTFEREVEYPHDAIRLMLMGDSVMLLCTKIGARLHYLKTANTGYVHLLPDVTINAGYIDGEGGWWFCSNRQGIYKLNSRSMRNVRLKGAGNRTVAVNAIVCEKKTMLLGSELSSIFEFNLANHRSRAIHVEGNIIYSKSDINEMLITPSGILYGTGQHLALLDRNYKVLALRLDISVKKIIAEHDKTILVATSNSVVRINSERLSIVDTLWHQRATTIFLDGTDLYVGTLNGLYLVRSGKAVVFLGDSIPVLRNRVNALLKSPDGNIWAATYGGGLVAFNEFRLSRYINSSSGLVSDLCKGLFLQDTYLWVGTDKGLNKIDISDLSAKKLPITTYTVADGLASDNINTVYATDSTVFVGSPAGLSFFKEKEMEQHSLCLLRITGIYVNGERFAYDSSHFQLPHQKNNIRLEFSGISFRSVGDITYQYRLIGLDTNWTVTKEPVLNYPTLPSGEYELQLQAINKFGVRSEGKKIRFTIAQLTREKTWFRALAGLIFLSLVALMLWYLNQRVRKREEEKTRINKRISELEQLALKSQMNPHFVFNSLNSIQQYVMDKDVSGANKFISGFSRLIRQTLDFSSKPLVHLQDEVAYLQTYLELEKNRLEEKFNYRVDVSDELKREDYYLPPMVLQPFVENSLRHGIRYRRDNNGVVLIKMYRQENRLVCVIEDNGVGREQAARNKRANPIEYQSKGMTLTANRIDLFNKDREEKIKVEIEDLFHADGSAAGTRVTVSFPEDFQL